MKTTLMHFSALIVFCVSPLASASWEQLNAAIPSEGTGTTYISPFGEVNIPVRYEIKDGNAVMGGDILLGSVAEAEAWRISNEQNDGDPRSVIISALSARWPNNTVPYTFVTTDATVQGLVAQAIAHWQQLTAIRFVVRTPENAAQYPNYIKIISSDQGCYSYIGMTGRINDNPDGGQQLQLEPNCGFGAAVHEFGHALGLFHEQSRSDRDSFVDIFLNNVCCDAQSNFDNAGVGALDVGAYDYGSIMHYGQCAFTIDDACYSDGVTARTIVPKNPGAIIGNRAGLSAGDIASINIHYPGAVTPLSAGDEEESNLLLLYIGSQKND